ncbi:MAG: hypothetical protein IJ757_00955 [Clostridiales bacterium]|nr:hypothetical protein [Clostridiales bacterium]
MTYRLNPAIEKIESPVTIVLLDTGQEKRYSSGAEATRDTFDHGYNIRSMKAVDGMLVIEMELADSPDETFF